MEEKHNRDGSILRPFDPNALNFIDTNDQNGTIMVDDIMSRYDPAASQRKFKSFKQSKPRGSIEKLVDSDEANDASRIGENDYRASDTGRRMRQKQKEKDQNSDEYFNRINADENETPHKEKSRHSSDYGARMRQELSGEDVYTLRFSTTLPITTDSYYGDSQKQHQSYQYNGTLNRPAFEIVSHADVRPATPIKFEEAKELRPRYHHHHSLTAGKKRKSSMSPKKCDQRRRTCMPSFSDQVHYNEHISVGPGLFESSSWIESSSPRGAYYCVFSVKAKYF